MVVDDTKEIKECGVVYIFVLLLKVSFSPINVRLKGCMHKHFHIRLGFACAVFLSTIWLLESMSLLSNWAQQSGSPRKIFL